MMFVVKSIVATVVIVMLMQIEFGGRTLESRAERWLTTSMVTEQLRQVAGGAIKITSDLWKKGHRWAGLDSGASVGQKPWSVEFRHRKTGAETEAD
ncbi:MAG: hypothetical protein KF767_04035 [Bdellovibrionaceae bacterium]|nr:hypothetical protein [Pseudobdellovibrionaceae bacterium]